MTLPPIPYNKESDSTFYFPKSEEDEQNCGKQLDTTVTLQEEHQLTKLPQRNGRALVASMLRGQYYSVTVRKDQWAKDKQPGEQIQLDSESKLASAETLRRAYNPAVAAPSEWDKDIPTDKYLIGAEDLVTILCQHLFSDNGYNAGKPVHPLKGLLVFSGQTGSGKSELLRRFLIRYLRGVNTARKPPHLVTFEDPIETLLWSDGRGGQIKGWAQEGYFPIDYTPRQKGVDADSLEDALSAALRQTPAAMYVGETRSRGDWKNVLDFAATGHLIVTTSHAGSLAESMDALLTACQAKSPTGRSEIAARVLGLVHIRAHSIENGRPGTATVKSQIPAMWRRTTLGQKSLMSEGLSAMTPGYSARLDSEMFCFGRTHFAEQILKLAPAGEGLDIDKHDQLRATCRTWDLAGE